MHVDADSAHGTPVEVGLGNGGNRRPAVVRGSQAVRLVCASAVIPGGLLLWWGAGLYERHLTAAGLAAVGSGLVLLVSGMVNAAVYAARRRAGERLGRRSVRALQAACLVVLLAAGGFCVRRYVVFRREWPRSVERWKSAVADDRARLAELAAERVRADGQAA